MKSISINGSIIKVKTKLGMTLSKKLKGINTNPYFTRGIDNDEKYFVNLETLEITKANNKASNKNDFRFNVEYQDNRLSRGWHQKDVSVVAENMDEAIEKLQKRFKVIFEYSEI